MNSAFAATGVDAVYVALPVREQDAAQAMEMIRRFGLGGVNVTMPLKQAIVPYLDQLAPTAQQGRASSALQLGDSLFSAVALALVSNMLFALQPWSTAAAYFAGFGFAAALALVAAVLAARVRVPA